MRPQRRAVALFLLLALLTLPGTGVLAQGGNDAELARIGEETGMVASRTATSPACTYSNAYAVYLCPEVPTNPPPADPAAAARTQAFLAQGGTLLLVPDSTNDRVMAFNAADGEPINLDFIPADATVGTGVNVILNAAGDGFLLSDQTGDVVHQYTLAGARVGIFAPAGGANTSIMNNVRGISLHPNGNLLVTSGDAPAADLVAQFDTAGAPLTPFIPTGTGGLDSPFDIRAFGTDWLVASINSDNVLRYDAAGAFLNVFAPVSNFPEQISLAANGNVLVANFSGTEGIYEFTPAGTLVGTYDPAPLTGYRGVYELGNGNLLVTTGTGVHEISRSNTLIESEVTSVSGRFIEAYSAAGPTATPTPTATETATITATATTVPSATATTAATATSTPGATSIELGTVATGSTGSALGWVIGLLGLTLLGGALVLRRR